ncbi:MAG: hypothetical protein WDZ60_08845, partial [Wenzhouxiangellaceae bacterium]
MPSARIEFSEILILRWLALAGYPALVVLAWWLEQPGYRALGMPLLAVAVVGVPRTWARAGVVAAASLPAGLVFLYPALALWPPSLILLALTTLFAYSLGRARRPMIERFARTPRGIHGQLRARQFLPRYAGMGFLDGKLIASAHLYFGVVLNLDRLISAAESVLLVTSRPSLRDAIEFR